MTIPLAWGGWRQCVSGMKKLSLGDKVGENPRGLKKGNLRRIIGGNSRGIRRQWDEVSERTLVKCR